MPANSWGLRPLWCTTRLRADALAEDVRIGMEQTLPRAIAEHGGLFVLTFGLAAQK
jgi:hypothetical protein